MPDAPRFTQAFREEVRAHVARHAGADDARALRELLVTVALFVLGMWLGPLLWHVARAAAGGVPSSTRPAAIVALAIVALAQVGTFIRLFLLHHDMMHGWFFRRRLANRLGALVAGTLSGTAPSVWKREHDRHHRDSNNLDREQDGQTASWTTQRYLDAPPWHRRAYYLLNIPLTMFTVLPLAYFLGFMRVKGRWHENLLFAGLLAAVVATGRLGYFLVTFAMAASLGFYLFHLQHTFPSPYRRHTDEWDFFDNGMLGSSYLELPESGVMGAVLRFFTYGVGYHHVHHLDPRIAGYQLALCHEEGGHLFDECPRVRLLAGLRTLHFLLYDEATGRFASVANLPRLRRRDHPTV